MVPAPVTVVSAVAMAEMVSYIYYAFVSNMGFGQRYFPAGLICTIPVCVILRHIISDHFPVTKVPQAVKVSVMLTLFFSCLHAPNLVYSYSTLTFFLVHAVHKIFLILTIILTYLFFKV